MADLLLYYTGGGDAVYAGEETKRTYHFRAGTPTLVDERDAKKFLDIRKKYGCCGNAKKLVPIFELGSN